MAKKSAFPEWLKSQERLQLQIKLGINASSVSHWLAGRSLPNPFHLKGIVKMSRGKVTYADIIEYYLSVTTRTK